jgi:hypothetical protein
MAHGIPHLTGSKSKLKAPSLVKKAMYVLQHGLEPHDVSTYFDTCHAGFCIVLAISADSSSADSRSWT